MLYFDILKNQHTEAKRNLTSGKDRFAQCVIFLSMAFWAAYLLFLGGMLPSVLKTEWPNMEPHHVVDRCLVPILFFDFIIRLILSSPTHAIRPYLLLPLSRKKVIQSILLYRIIQPRNLFALFFFIPFALSTIAQIHGMTGVAGYTLGIWLLMVMNNYWSLLIDTLMRQRFAYAFFSLIVYLPLLLIEFCSGTDRVSTATMHLAEGFIAWKPWAFTVIVIFIAILFGFNYKMQLRLIHKELSHQDDRLIKSTGKRNLLHRLGYIGEYLMLDLKMTFRNKRLRTRFWSTIFITTLFSAALAAGLYEGQFMKLFICLYCYTLSGVMSLSRIMSAEGNFIDGLMVRKECISRLLLARYYLQCLFLIFPFSLYIIPVILGQISLLMSMACMMFTAGVTFCGLMQTAVFNDITMPLNTAVAAKRSPNNAWSSIITGIAFCIPPFLCKTLVFCLGENQAYIVMILSGAIGVITHHMWLHNICVRMMKRRYQNLEGFRNTR